MTPEVLYDRGGVTLYIGSCVDLMETLEAVDHVITDPPFEPKAHAFGMLRDETGKIAQGPLPFAPISKELRSLCGQRFAVLAKRWVIVFCQVEAVNVWRSSLGCDGLEYVRTCVWTKPDAAPNISGDCPGHGYESIVTYHASDNHPKLNGSETSVFSFNSKEQNRIHTTQKPQKLMREPIRLYTDPGDLVLDPFAGSGSTAAACKVLGRRCITIEKDPEFAARACKRLESMDKQGDMFAVEEDNG